MVLGKFQCQGVLLWQGPTVLCRYLALYLLYINIDIGKNRC